MRFLLLSTLALLVFTGCDSADDAAGSAACAAAGLTSTGSMTATVGGDSFTAVCVSGQSTNGVLALAGIANLGETGANQRQINLTFPGAAVGSVSLNPLGGAIATYASLDLSNPTDPNGVYTGLSGTAEVTSLTATGAEGTFRFTGQNSAGQIEITGGRFDITF